MKDNTYRGQLGNDNAQDGKKIDGEIRCFVMGIMRAEKEKQYWNAEEKFLCGGVLISIVDLFPHIQIVVSTSVEFERHAAHIMKHEVGAEHIRNVGQRPRCFLRDTGNDVEQDFEGNDENDVNCPCS